MHALSLNIAIPNVQRKIGNYQKARTCLELLPTDFNLTVSSLKHVHCVCRLFTEIILGVK